jgi:pimeloyl-ACP methyl ester carboxylesterase
VAAFSLVHGSEHGGWVWAPLRAELETRGHAVAAPDLPCEDVDATLDHYAAVVPAADVAVGHSLGGLTIPRVPARMLVFVCAVVPGIRWGEAVVPAFSKGLAQDELGRWYHADPAAAAGDMQYPPEHAPLAGRLRRQVMTRPVTHSDDAVPDVPRIYVAAKRDRVLAFEWQLRVAREVLGVEPIVLDSGHSPMLEKPHELADVLETAAREVGVA